jgi:uncharacterized protein (DUF1499 family)
MMAYPFQREPRRARWAWRLARFSLALLVVGAAGHRLDFVDTPSFLAVAALVALLAVLAMLIAWSAIVRLWQVDELGIGKAFAASLLALAVLAPFGLGAILYATGPGISDISTDTANPPALREAARLRGGWMNPVRPIGEEAALRQREHYPEVTGRRYEHDRNTVQEVVQTVAAQRGWRVTRQADPRHDGATITIEYEARSLVLGFVSDVAIRLRDEFGSTYVDLRSASRYGDYDFGDNARRIAGFMERLDEAMAMIPIIPVD